MWPAGTCLRRLQNKRVSAPDGWLWTGDRCVMDDDGYIRVLGRTREMIIRNGLNVSPAEIEGYLRRTRADSGGRRSW